MVVVVELTLLILLQKKINTNCNLIPNVERMRACLNRFCGVGWVVGKLAGALGCGVCSAAVSYKNDQYKKNDPTHARCAAAR